MNLHDSFKGETSPTPGGGLDYTRPQPFGVVGRIIPFDEDEVEWFAAMLDYFGRDKGTRFMRALSRQEPQLRRGHTLLAKLLA